MVYFLIVSLLAAADLLFLWWADSRLRRLRKATAWRVVMAVLVGGQFVMLGLIIWPGVLRALGNTFWKPVSAWVYMWHLLVLPCTLVGLLLGYCVLWLAGFFTRVADRLHGTPEREGVPEPVAVAGIAPTRRQVLAATAAFVPQAMLAYTLAESARQHGHFRVRRMELALPQLPKGLDGLTLAHVSDTHVGRFIGPRELDAVAETVANLKPDLTVFTGDLIDFNLIDLDPALSALRQIEKVAPLAMCVGNHDIFEDGKQFRRRVRTAEIGLMIDESMPLEIRPGQKIELLGLDWGTPTAPRADAIEEHMRALLRRRRTAHFPILLAHHPHAFDPAAAAGIPLTLSGHTHGGQIMFTPNWGAGRVYRYWSGLYEKGGSKLVVSNGVGNWFPLRIGAPAEIIHLTLRSA